MSYLGDERVIERVLEFLALHPDLNVGDPQDKFPGTDNKRTRIDVEWDLSRASLDIYPAKKGAQGKIHVTGKAKTPRDNELRT